jgi:hypothetical protein
MECNSADFFTRLELPLDFESHGRIVVDEDTTLGCSGNHLLVHANILAKYCVGEIFRLHFHISLISQSYF